MAGGRGTELATLLILAAAVGLGLATAGAPRAVPATAPDTVFSAERARNELGVLARAPHPVGSDEHDLVRDELLGRLQALGFSDVQVQHTTGFNTLGGVPRAATVDNVLARRPGTESTGAVLLTAHYDAVPRSFGAADDGAGVAAILETLRALGAAPLRNDLIVLFSDAEEPGLLGAEAFVDQHPWGKDVRVVLNFEARGTTGPSYMFQTSQGNGALIDLLATNVPDARANSLTGEVYRHLPSDTDLSIWLHSSDSVAAMNFAFIGGYPDYHTPLDNLATLDLRSLQHHGDYALPLARAFGRADLRQLHRRDDVYFNAPLVGLIRYPEQAAMPLAVGVAIATLLLIGAAVARRRATLAGVATGAVALIAGIAVPAGVALGGWRLIRAMHPDYASMLQGDPYGSSWYLLGFAAVTLAIVVVIQHVAARWATPIDAAIAPLVLWAAAGVVVAARLPGASYLLAWPLLGVVVGCAIALRAPTALAAVFAAPVLLLFPPLIASLESALTANFIAGAAAILAFALALIVIQLRMVGSLWRWAMPVVLLVAAGGIVAGELDAATTPRRKHPDSLAYLLDSDARTAWWVSTDRSVDAWTSEALGPAPERRSFAAYHLVRAGDSLLAADAPVAEVPLPQVQVLARKPAPGGRRLHLRLGVVGGAESLSLIARDSSLSVSDVVLNGRALADGDSDRYRPLYHTGRDGTVLTYYGVPAQGIDLWLTVHSAAPAEFLLSISTEGFPEVPGTPSRRVASFMSKPFVPTDVTIVARTVRF